MSSTLYLIPYHLLDAQLVPLEYISEWTNEKGLHSK